MCTINDHLLVIFVINNYFLSYNKITNTYFDKNGYATVNYGFLVAFNR